jgi:LysM repeat protein
MRNATLLLITLLLLASPAPSANHVVERGDTLYSLAREFGVSVSELMDANGIDDPRSLRVGQVLTVPGTEPEVESTATHTVTSGETLYGLARRFGVTVAELRRINDMGPTEVLLVGRELIVPGGAAPVSASIAEDPDPAGVEPSLAPIYAPNSDVTWPHDGRRVPLTGTLKGIEILGSRGDDVVSVSRGTVTLVQPFRSFIKLVIVESDDQYIYVYGGCDETFVQTGDRVESGTRLGTLGTAPGGVSKVYFAVHKDSRYVDPASAPRM